MVGGSVCARSIRGKLADWNRNQCTTAQSSVMGMIRQTEVGKAGNKCRIGGL